MTQFSYSRIGCFKQCPYQYKLKYVDKLKTLPDTEASNALYLGTALHTGLEKNIKEALEQYYSNYPVIDNLQINEAIKLEHIIPKGKESIPNGSFEVKIDDDEFVGYIDLLVSKGNNHFDIWDFKYSNNVDRYLESGQLHVYKYFYEKTHEGHIVDNLYFIFLPKIQIRQKKTEDIYQFRKRLCEELSKAEVRIERLEYNPTKVKEYLDGVEEAKTASEFPKNETRLCDWCEFESYCKRKEDTMLLPENKRRDVNKINKKVLWIYGSPFSGKTVLANKFPDPLMLNTDGNIKFVDAPYISIKDEVIVEGRITKRKPAWELFKEVVEELEKKQNDFKTIVVDLLEDTYEHCRAYKYAEMGVEHESDAGFGKGYDIIRKEFLDTIKRLTNLDYENIVLISHEDSSKNITRRSGENTTTIRPNLQEKLASKISGMVDIVGRTFVENDKYYLSFKTNDLVFGGGRLGVKGQDIVSDYNELLKVYGEANDTTVAKNASVEVKSDQPTNQVSDQVEQPSTERRRVVVNK